MTTNSIAPSAAKKWNKSSSTRPVTPGAPARTAGGKVTGATQRTLKVTTITMIRMKRNNYVS